MWWSLTSKSLAPSSKILHKLWQPFIPKTACLEYIQADIQDWLPDALKQHPSDNVAVVACHACGQLNDVTIDTCIQHQVPFAIMPCCHKKTKENEQMQHVAKLLGIEINHALDIFRMGRICQQGYNCRWTVNLEAKRVNPNCISHNILIGGLCCDCGTTS